MEGIFFNGAIEDNFISHILKEVYVDRVYDQFLLGKENLVMVDIGANIGLTTQYFTRFAKKIYSVEPAKEHYDCLVEMVKFNKFKQVVPIKRAVGRESGLLTLKHNANRTMFSLSEGLQGESGEEVSVITMEDLFRDWDIKQADFVKLDVEGVEMEIIGGEAFANIADKIKTILIEHHVWSGRHQGQLVQSLQKYGFKVKTVPTDASLFVGFRE